jgi:Phage tail lysozyme
MPVKAGYLLLAGGGGVFVWSGIKGKSISSVFRQLAGGDAPTGASGANPIASVTPAANVSPPGTTPSGTAAPGPVAAGSDLSNMEQVAEYLVEHGYSKIAAAGICGCIAGESGGNPESVGSGGAGLIGWTPPSSASPISDIVTGNASKDLASQMEDLLTYNNNQGSGLISELNAQTSPLAAADFYSQNFERPAVTDSDVRESVAEQVYSYLQSSNVPTG